VIRVADDKVNAGVGAGWTLGLPEGRFAFSNPFTHVGVKGAENGPLTRDPTRRSLPWEILKRFSGVSALRFYLLHLRSLLLPRLSKLDQVHIRECQAKSDIRGM
jgi:hypothetical protein